MQKLNHSGDLKIGDINIYYELFLFRLITTRKYNAIQDEQLPQYRCAALELRHIL